MKANMDRHYKRQYDKVVEDIDFFIHYKTFYDFSDFHEYKKYGLIDRAFADAYLEGMGIERFYISTINWFNWRSVLYVLDVTAYKHYYHSWKKPVGELFALRLEAIK